MTTATSEELDPAGHPKLELTVLEREAIACINTIKAWREAPPGTPFPVQADMRMDAILLMSTMRRKGVR